MSDLLASIRAGLLANLDSIPDAKASAYEKAAPSAPTIEVLARYEIEYDVSNDADAITMFVRVLVRDSGDGEATQRQLDKYAARSGVYSVKAAIESDRTLGGVVDDARVTGVSEVQPYSVATVPNANVFGATWTVEITASY